MNSSIVKFDSKGVPYVEIEDLRRRPKVKKQIEAARRVMQRIRERREGERDSNGPGER